MYAESLYGLKIRPGTEAGYSGDRGTAIRDVKEKPNTKRPRDRKQKIQSDKENTESQA